MAKRKREGGTKGCAKSGRNVAWCKVYRARCIREINKKGKIARHIRNFDSDLQAKEVYKNL